ncbi:Histidine kinase/HSP90-like domain-containing protein [Desulfonema limicola]|uniref:histidine kinase n=1 Tax=Desulfonema limicola TaxID=45656 RepID=A0A975B6Q9_9BACT|nr:HAMP domain-containing sensor histidine kinase [Desulfonema limicola]QTA79853.1 Histidine kinase/HSP90-like domain-containing protein [Desulfonema limicola]
MKQLRLIILIFCLSLSIPLGYFVLRSYQSLYQEDMAQLRYFAETLFDEMEQELAIMIRQEENRAVDEYNYFYTPPGSQNQTPSPISSLPGQSYILGYFQNNPDGSFQTPLIEKNKPVPKELTRIVNLLTSVNTIFNQKRSSSSEIFEIQPITTLNEKKEKESNGFADRFLNTSRAKEQKQSLGQTQKRVEEISETQALNIAQKDSWENVSKKSKQYSALAPAPEIEALKSKTDLKEPAKKLEAELDPMQSVFITQKQIYIFRRIVINNQVFRQGFVINPLLFLEYMIQNHFIKQPMAGFTHLELRVRNRGITTGLKSAGIAAKNPGFLLEHTFPRPFSFLYATLTCEKIPRSAGRKTLNFMVAGLAGIMFLGLFFIYRSAMIIAELSERKSKFVSSVTHELKTPLTNIRMYIEMLEQGIAGSPDREQEYFRILGSESSRLSRLINNILEFSKLEKKHMCLNMKKGGFEEVIGEVRDVMGQNIFNSGFKLNVENINIRPFFYDREVMIQVLINLIENSMKFGRDSEIKEISIRVYDEKKWVNISVSDTGPGIPQKALKKVFEDFFRVESALIQNTRGTGIGLAFVKKAVSAMGGKVSAANNQGPGCTISILLPSAAV